MVTRPGLVYQWGSGERAGQPVSTLTLVWVAEEVGVSVPVLVETKTEDSPVPEGRTGTPGRSGRRSWE